MKDPDSAPSPNRFWSRLGMRNAALNASTAMLFWPNSSAISRTRSSPASRLTRMPAPTEVSGRATRRTSDLRLKGTRQQEGRSHVGVYGTRDSGLGTRDSGLGTRDSGLGTRGSQLELSAARFGDGHQAG